MKNPLRVLLYVLLAAIVAGLIWFATRDKASSPTADEAATETSPGSAQEHERSGDNEAAGADGSSERSLEGLPAEELDRIMEEGRELSPEEQHRLAVEAARELNDGNDPTSCETHCDCPQGQTCQPGSNLCLPSPFKTWCCDRDGCPEGQQCVHMDGTYGTCGDGN